MPIPELYPLQRTVKINQIAERVLMASLIASWNSELY